MRADLFALNVDAALFLGTEQGLERLVAVGFGLSVFADKVPKATAADLGDAQENLEVEYQGERLEMGYNAKYFIDALQAMESEIIELGFIDNSSPCMITGSVDTGFLGLIMPMRL